MQSISVKATCANCQCKGKLFKRKKRVILIPTAKILFQGAEEEKEANSERYEKGFLAPHGFATAKQVINFLFWGSLFWVTIMLLANYVSFEKNRFKAGVQGRGYGRALRASSSYFLKKKILKNLRGKVQFSLFERVHVLRGGGVHFWPFFWSTINKMLN